MKQCQGAWHHKAKVQRNIKEIKVNPYPKWNTHNAAQSC